MNHIWIIENRFYDKSWYPLSEVYYTRAEARVARQNKIARLPVATKYRVVPYVPRVNHCKKPNAIHSMEEYQRKYFPGLVGKECPHCGRKLGIQGAFSGRRN